MIFVSACLIGENCNYRGKNNYSMKIVEFLKNKNYLCFCPELFGNLPIPRDPIEILPNEQAISKNGKNMTKALILGAKKTLQLCQKYDVELIILKDGSPSCGVHFIYDGTFSRVKKFSMGKTAKILYEHGFIIKSENDF